MKTRPSESSTWCCFEPRLKQKSLYSMPGFFSIKCLKLWFISLLNFLMQKTGISSNSYSVTGSFRCIGFTLCQIMFWRASLLWNQFTFRLCDKEKAGELCSFRSSIKFLSLWLQLRDVSERLGICDTYLCFILQSSCSLSPEKIGVLGCFQRYFV
jgi:hypothetical protein